MEAVASVITIAGLAYTLQKVVHEIKEEDEEVQRLERKVERLIAVIDEVKRLYGSQETRPFGSTDESETANVRALVEDTTKACGDDLKRFQNDLYDLMEKKPTFGDPLVRRWRQRHAAPTFARLEKQIEGHQLSLQLLINTEHGHSLAETRKAMAKGFAAVLASNGLMFTKLQELADPPQSLDRRDTEATLVPALDETEEGEQPAFVFESDNPLHEFLKGLFAVWTKDVKTDDSFTDPVPPPDRSGEHLTPGNQHSSLNVKDSHFDDYRVRLGQERRISSPGVDPANKDCPLTPSMSSASNGSRASRLSNASTVTTSTSRSSISASSQPSHLDQKRGRARQSVENRKNRRAPHINVDEPTEEDRNSCDSKDVGKGFELLQHVQGGSIEHVEALIADNASLEEIDDKYGRTPLLHATYKGRKDVVDLLLRKGADLQAQDNQQSTALHLAIRRPSAHGIVPALIDADNRFQRDSREEFERLVNIGDKIGRTPLHECVRLAASTETTIDVTKLLLAESPDINALDDQGLPPAFYALDSRKVDIVDLLLAHEEKAEFGSFSWPEPDKITKEIARSLESKGYTRPETRSKDSRQSIASKRPSVGRSSPSISKKTRQLSVRSS
ncbi:uncharacterized protein KY384_001660 [Bacidia gigantensis]|uniref:uncharacterized protein n=1 Tax=Bacidia gigantensis TaxID=2732470 RepID=UPI001D04F5F1|nr:uncharacterized protein KY384_001660 [Bacidia gigantensis]KAG8533919.1 hypothetical protein KY384_001660 [Bacidia gigantensis]